MNKSDLKQHDLKIFNEFESEFNEVILKEIIEFIPTNLRSNQYYYNYLDNLEIFAGKSANKYIDNELNIKFKSFINATSTMNSLCGNTMVFDDYPGTKNETDFPNAKESELKSIYRSQRYLVPKEPYDNDWESFQIERRKTQKKLNDASDLILETYDNFRMEIKKKLYV